MCRLADQVWWQWNFVPRVEGSEKNKCCMMTIITCILLKVTMYRSISIQVSVMQTRLIRPTATLGFKRNSAHDVWSTFFVRARDKNSLRKHGKCIYWMKHCVLRLPRYWTYVNSAVCWISVNQRGIFVWTCQIPWDIIEYPIHLYKI